MGAEAELSVNIYDAKSSFSKLVARAEQGDRVTITRHGRPVARLVPYAVDAPVRRAGAWRGRIVIGEDFDSFDTSDAAEWYGA